MSRFRDFGAFGEPAPPSADQLEEDLKAFLSIFGLPFERIEAKDWVWIMRNIPPDHKEFPKARQLIIQALAVRRKQGAKFTFGALNTSNRGKE